MTDKIVELAAVRKRRLLDDGPAFDAGYRPAEKLADWYLDGGYTYGDMLHAMAYSAAAQLFRDLPAQDAAVEVRSCFELILKDLRQRGPHYGHEPY
jgi:hypothetical protein